MNTSKRYSWLTLALIPAIALIMVFAITTTMAAASPIKSQTPAVYTEWLTSRFKQPSMISPSVNATTSGGIITNPSIDTTPYWDGVKFIKSFGMPNTASYGQTISLTESAALSQFSFFMAVTPTAVFRGYVFEWDGLKATGTPLFESAPMSTTQGTNFEEVVFNIPDKIALSAGKQYVLFASTSKDPAQPNSAGSWGAVFTNTVYNGGVFLNNGTDPTKWISSTWGTIAADLAFKATLHRPVFLPVIIR